MLRNWSFPPGALGDTEGPQPKTGQARYASRVVPWAAGWGAHPKGARRGAGEGQCRRRDAGSEDGPSNEGNERWTQTIFRQI